MVSPCSPTVPSSRCASTASSRIWRRRSPRRTRSKPVTIDSPDGLAILRHSTAHVLAQAVQRINPQAKLGIGPPITDGFYYDFGVDTPFTPEDLKAISKEMERIQREGQRFVRRVVTDDEARAELADEPFKLELIGLKGPAPTRRRGRLGRGRRGRAHRLRQRRPKDGETVWKDLCRGPHLPNTRHDPQRLGPHPHRRRLLARIREEPAAAAHLRHRVADQGRAARVPAAPRGGRQARPPQLGQELDLFSFPDEIGSGLAVFHPRGGIIRGEMEQHARSGTSRPATPTCTPRTSRRRTCSSPRTTWSPIGTACSRRSGWTRSATRTGTSPSRARTTT